MVSFKSTFVLVAGLGLASAQSNVTISQKCQQALATVVLSPAGQCLNAQALVALATVDANTSLIGPINNWLTGLCAKPACTNDVLSGLVSNVTAGCESELQGLGIGNINQQEITSAIEQGYPAFREIACLTDSNDGGALCVTETLTNIEAVVGTLSETGIENLVKQAFAGQIPNVPSNVTCTNCVKAAFNIINTDFPGVISADANSTIQNQCGASFTDGTTPSGISQSAVSSSASPASAAVNTAGVISAGSIGVMISSFITLGAAVAIFL